MERHSCGGDHQEPAGVRVLPGGREGDLQLQHRGHPDPEMCGQDLGKVTKAGTEEQEKRAQKKEEGEEGWKKGAKGPGEEEQKEKED